MNSINKNTCKNGFTLAEVLITLVIVGVIASLTIPTTINNVNKTETVTRLKKAYSTLVQTVNRSTIDNGHMTIWDMGSTGDGQAADDFNKKYLIPYLNLGRNCGTLTAGSCDFKFSYLNSSTEQSLNSKWARFYLGDGTFIATYTQNSGSTVRLQMCVDINGQKKPNKMGRDVFLFNLTVKESSITEGKITPDGIGYNRDTLVSSAASNCNKATTGIRCASLIMKDGWKIESDYPW